MGTASSSRTSGSWGFLESFPRRKERRRRRQERGGRTETQFHDKVQGSLTAQEKKKKKKKMVIVKVTMLREKVKEVCEKTSASELSEKVRNPSPSGRWREIKREKEREGGSPTCISLFFDLC